MITTSTVSDCRSCSLKEREINRTNSDGSRKKRSKKLIQIEITSCNLGLADIEQIKISENKKKSESFFL